MSEDRKEMRLAAIVPTFLRTRSAILRCGRGLCARRSVDFLWNWVTQRPLIALAQRNAVAIQPFEQRQRDAAAVTQHLAQFAYRCRPVGPDELANHFGG